MTDEQLQDLADLMVWGVNEPLHVDGKDYAPFTPLPAGVAADFMGIRRRRARVAMSDPKFRKLFATNLEAMRNGERARNLHVAISIRDELGEGLAADRTVRLKAIQTIEGKEAGGVSVTVNNVNGVQNVVAGYVIKLRPSEPTPSVAAPSLPASSSPAMIDVTPNAETVDVR